MKDDSLKNILIVKNRALGDSIMGLSTISYIRSLYPHAYIIYAIPAWITPLYKNIETDANEILSIDLSGPISMIRLWKTLKNKRIDSIYEMHQRGRSAKFFSLYSKFSKAKYNFHNHHLSSGGPIHDQGVIKSLIQRDLDGAYSIYSKSKKIPNYLDFAPILKIRGKKKLKKKKIIMGVVATRRTKMWPLKNYAELTQMILEYNSSYEILIPLSKSEKDNEIKKELLNIVASNTIFIQKSLEDLPTTFSESSFYIGNDTGLKHLAVAQGLKSFTFFGPEPPDEWHPYCDKKHPYFYLEPLACRVQKSHYCALFSCGDMTCLKSFSAEVAMEKIKKELI